MREAAGQHGDRKLPRGGGVSRLPPRRRSTSAACAAPVDDPRIDGLHATALDRINALADAQPGFVWRARGRRRRRHRPPARSRTTRCWRSTCRSGRASTTLARLRLSLRASGDHAPAGASGSSRPAARRSWRCGGSRPAHRPSIAECLERLEHFRRAAPPPRLQFRDAASDLDAGCAAMRLPSWTSRRMKAAVIVFPGSNCDRDCKVAIERSTGARSTWSGTARPPCPPAST